MKNYILILIASFALIITSCKKEIDNEPVENPQDIQELVVPLDFDWKTTAEFQLTLSGPTNGLIEVTNAEGFAYQKAFLTANQTYTTKLTVPTFEKKVTLKYAGQEVILDLNAAELQYEFK
jgi:hypothetical protein